VGLLILLLIGCAVLLVVRDFRLGLDMRGGVEVVLDARPLPGQTVTQTDLNTSTSILRRRIDPDGTLSPEIRSSTNPAQVTVDIPGIKDPAAAESLLVSSGQLQSFDLFQYLDPASRGTQQYSAAPASSWRREGAAEASTPKGSDRGRCSTSATGSWARSSRRRARCWRTTTRRTRTPRSTRPGWRSPRTPRLSAVTQPTAAPVRPCRPARSTTCST
jgi:preprotein translocase subunit SecD